MTLEELKGVILLLDQEEIDGYLEKLLKILSPIGIKLIREYLNDNPNLGLDKEYETKFRNIFMEAVELEINSDRTIYKMKPITWKTEL